MGWSEHCVAWVWSGLGVAGLGLAGVVMVCTGHGLDRTCAGLCMGVLRIFLCWALAEKWLAWELAGLGMGWPCHYSAGHCLNWTGGAVDVG
jgi:hypothetical protein